MKVRMKTMKSKLITIFLLLFAVTTVMAQSEYTRQIKIEKEVVKEGNEAVVNLNFILDSLRLNSKHMLILTPTIVSPEEHLTRELAPIVLLGGNKQKSVKRTQKLNDEPKFEIEPYMMTQVKKNESLTIPYTIRLPYKKWIREASIVMHESIEGCAGCGLGEEEYPILGPIWEKPEYIPMYTVTFITPEVEEIKKREEVEELRLNYKVNRYDILPQFGSNEQELAKFAKTYSQIRNNPDVKFKGIKIVGYASPEGRYEANMKLSENRAKSLAAYFQKKHNIDAKVFNIEWKGEDWEGLLKSLETYDVEGKAEIIDIIKNTANNEERKNKLKALRGGRPYALMLRDIYPPLRRNKCVVEYDVEQFNLEKSREIIKTNPKLLSLNEMFLVAQSYEKGSPEYNAAFETAAATYPNDPVAVINVAGMAIENKEYARAINLLERFRDNADAWNNMGVALAKTERFDEARSYFTRAMQESKPHAQENLEKMVFYLDDRMPD